MNKDEVLFLLFVVLISVLAVAYAVQDNKMNPAPTCCIRSSR